MVRLRSTPDGVELPVRVIPMAKRDEITGERNNALCLRVSAPPVEEAAPPAGEVTVTGFLLPPVENAGAASERSPDGRILAVTSLDVATVLEAVPAPPVPLAMQLQEVLPASTIELPRVVPPPGLSEGPHLSYAIQWFTFATIALVGYAVLVRREIRDRDRERATTDPT